jgi:hypothetical protein
MEVDLNNIDTVEFTMSNSTVLVNLQSYIDCEYCFVQKQLDVQLQVFYEQKLCGRPADFSFDISDLDKLCRPRSGQKN